ncbi:MAG: PRC-barrel domain-containing protein [Streptosporangiaceae bacterium]
MSRPIRFVLEEVVPAGETQVRPGEHVHALDGEIGRVQGLLVDPDDHRVTHVLLREGHLRGRKQVAIPVSAVTGIQNGIQLNTTKQQAENLPPVDIDHPS